MRKVLLISITLLLATACGGTMRELNTLARDDLRCDSNLTFTKVNDQTRIASGCGKEVTYVEQCDAKDECHWSRDSEVRRTSL
jgi:hypothetical protein